MWFSFSSSLCTASESYAADYAGASSAAAAAAWPRPAYDVLPQTPLPLPNGQGPMATPMSRASQRGGDGRGGGRGRSAISYQGRYFDAEPRAVDPGALSAELRALLGMRHGDPPPYLRRMRMLGYPPGYLGDPDAPALEEVPLELYPEEAQENDGKDEGGELGRAEGRGDSGQGKSSRIPRKVPLVDFPGLNVPPPPGVDLALWGWW